MKRIRQSEWVIVLSILLAAALIRFYQLDTLPPGLYHDEAINGLDALSVLEGEHPLYFEANNGREPLYIYLLAVSIRLLGATPVAIRLVSALLGTLFVGTVYLLGREIADRRIATWASCLAVTSIWAINLSRVGFRAVSFLPIATAALAVLIRSQKRHSPWAAVSGGALLGVSLYTYLASRMGLVVVALLLICLALWQRRQTWWRGILYSILSAGLVAAPFGIYVLTHWQETFGRAGQVSILNPAISGGQPVAMFWQNLWKTALAFFWRGDFIPRHNVPLRPVFDPLVAAFFGLGLLILAQRLRRDATSALVLLWFGVMLIPTLIAEDAPHFMRASGVLPVLYLIPAIGLDALARRFSATRLANALAAGIIAVAAALNLGAYLPHLHSDAAYYQFEGAAADLAVEVNDYLDIGWQGEGNRVLDDEPLSKRMVYIAPLFYDSWQSIPYLTSTAEQQGLLATDPSSLRQAEDAMIVFWPYEPWQALVPHLPGNRLISVNEGGYELGDLETEPRLLSASLSTTPVTAPDNIGAVFEQGIELVGYETQMDRDRLTVSLYWRCTEPIGSSLRGFVHLLESGTIVTQADGPLAIGYYGTELWRPGDVVQDVHTLTVAPEQSLEALELRVGLYHGDTLERLSASQDGVQATFLDLPANTINP